MITEELFLLLLDDRNGHLYPIPIDNLDCVLVGAVLMELQLEGRIDTDLESLSVLDPSPIGNDLLDPILEEVAAGDQKKSPAEWVLHLSDRGQDICDTVVARLVHRDVLAEPKEDGGVFRTQRSRRVRKYAGVDGVLREDVKLRIMKTLFEDAVPDPTDAALIGLANACEIFPHLLEARELSSVRERIGLYGKLDPIISAVSREVRAVRIRSRAEERPPDDIPLVKGIPILGNTLDTLRDLNQFYAEQYQIHGPVFRIRILGREFVVLCGPEANRLMMRRERFHFWTSRTLRESMRETLGEDIILSMNGTDHARMRREMKDKFSAAHFEKNFETAVELARKLIRTWPVNKRISGNYRLQQLFVEQLAVLVTGASVLEHVHDIDELFKILMVQNVFKGFRTLYARSRSRSLRNVENLLQKVFRDHQMSKRNRRTDIIDDLLELHHNDPVYMSELRLRASAFAPYFTAIDTVGQMGSFLLYYLMKDPVLMAKVRAEADMAFADGIPTPAALRELDVIHRLIKEALRLCPLAPNLTREVMSSLNFAGYKLPVGIEIHWAAFATHFLPEFFPEPEKFDIERYLDGRAEDRQTGIYVPFGGGLHRCIGAGFAEVQLALTILTIVREADFELDPPDYELKVRFKPVTRPAGKFGFRMTGLRSSVPA